MGECCEQFLGKLVGIICARRENGRKICDMLKVYEIFFGGIDISKTGAMLRWMQHRIGRRTWRRAVKYSKNRVIERDIDRGSDDAAVLRDIAYRCIRRLICTIGSRGVAIARS